MTHLTSPVSVYMAPHLVVARPLDTLEDAWERMLRRRVSSLPVVSEDGKTVGVVSRTDLLRMGQMSAVGRPGRPNLELPDELVSNVMSPRIVAVAPSTTVQEAAKTLVDGRIHRVFVEDDRRLVGVFSTRDVMQAVLDAEVAAPVEKFMSRNVETVPSTASLQTATQSLELFGHQGVVVTEFGLPVALFTQEDALAARERSPGTPVGAVVSYRLIQVAPKTPVYRAAGQALAARTRMVVVMDGQDLRGVLTSVDLAGAALLE